MGSISTTTAYHISERGSQFERLSNWVGFLCFLLLAIRIVVQSPVIGVWLLPSFLHELMTAVAFLTRKPLRRTASGFLPRAAAYGGTFIVPLFFAWAGYSHPQWLRPSPIQGMRELGGLVWVAGAVLGVWTVWSLRHSFSLVAQARSLVTSGPYRWARHPMYACYLLQYVGLWLAHWSLPLALAVLAWFALAAVRVHFEESVLQAEFPQYRQYQKTVGLFAPRLRRSPSLFSIGFLISKQKVKSEI